MIEEQNNKLRKFIEPGAEMAGAVCGAAIGLLMAGPPGAIGGAVAGPAISAVLKRTCIDLYDRTTGHRAKVRAGATAAYAIVAINQRLSEGAKIRDDNFFDADASRSSADELLEGIVIKSQNEHEEKKAKYYANILATAAFDSRFSSDSLNHVLSIAQGLTYRQLCLLRLFADPKPFALRESSFYEMDETSIPWETHAVLAESFDLYQRSMLIQKIPGEEQHALALLDLTSIEPNSLCLTETGKRVYLLMQLETLPEEDLRRVRDTLL